LFNNDRKKNIFLTLERDRKYFYYGERVQECLLLAAAGGLKKLQAGAADRREMNVFKVNIGRVMGKSNKTLFCTFRGSYLVTLKGKTPGKLHRDPSYHPLQGPKIKIH